jgi:hypothetical protein
MRARPRRRAGPAAAALALLAACSLLAACGKGGQPQQTATATASGATRAPAAPGRGQPLTDAQAAAFARAVNLTAADLPGFSASTKSQRPETPSEKRLEAQLQRCLGGHVGGGESGGKPPEERSQEFTHRGTVLRDTVSSAVSFSRSAVQAARDLAALRSARTRACLSRYLNGLLRSRLGGSDLKRVSLAQGTPPAPGTSGGFAWRITAYANVRGLSVPLYLDILGFVYGPAQVRLISSGVLVPFPASAQEHLYTTLLERAKAHHL